jgi:hypothetical protein
MLHREGIDSFLIKIETTLFPDSGHVFVVELEVSLDEGAKELSISMLSIVVGNVGSEFLLKLKIQIGNGRHGQSKKMEAYASILNLLECLYVLDIHFWTISASRCGSNLGMYSSTPTPIPSCWLEFPDKDECIRMGKWRNRGSALMVRVKM